MFVHRKEERPEASFSEIQRFPPRRLLSDSTPLTYRQSLDNELPFDYHSSGSWISGLTASTSETRASKCSVRSHPKMENSSVSLKGTNSFRVPKKQVSSLVPQTAVTGDGRDYFQSLFCGSSKCASSNPMEKRWKHFSTIFEDNQARSSALGHMKITDVHNGGLFVRLMNSSQDKELEIGNHYLQQNLNDHKVASYQFPPNLIMPAKCTVTVWAAASEAKHGPPSDFLWKKQNKFITSPNCTTILCKPNGEAIAWYTPIHWKQAWEKLETDIEFNRGSIASQRSTIHRPTSITTITKGKQDHPERVTSSCQVEYIPVLQREKEIPPTLFPTRSPWCHSPNNPGHPYNPLTKLYRAPNARTRMATGCRHHSAWPGIFPGIK